MGCDISLTSILLPNKKIIYYTQYQEVTNLQESEHWRCMSEEKIIDCKRQILNLDLVITQHISYVRSLTITAVID